MTEHHGPHSSPCQASSLVRCANSAALRTPAANGEYQRGPTVIELSTNFFAELGDSTRNRRARARPSDTPALRWVDVIGPVAVGKPAPTSCEELLYPVKEPNRFRSSNSRRTDDEPVGRRREPAPAYRLCRLPPPAVIFDHRCRDRVDGHQIGKALPHGHVVAACPRNMPMRRPPLDLVDGRPVPPPVAMVPFPDTAVGQRGISSRMVRSG